MIRLLFTLIFVSCAPVHAQNVKISQLPLGAASTAGSSDSFPYVNASTAVTERLTIWDIANIPTIVSTYAPKNNPIFTGTVTAPIFAGSVTGIVTGNVIGTASGNTTYTANNHGVVLSSTTNAMNVLAASTANTVLTANGGSSDPSWALIVNANVGAGASIAYSKLNLTTSIVNGDISTSAAIARSKIASGTINQVVENDGSGNLTSAATVSPTLGGTGQNFSSSTGVLQVSAGTVSAASVALASQVSGTLPLANGGLGITSGTSGGIPYFSSSSAVASSGVLAVNQVVLGGGAASSPVTVSSTGTSGQVLTSNGSSAPTWQAPPGGTNTAPTIQKFTTGSGTYTKPTSPAPLYIRVVLVGGGGGGGADSNTSNPGTNGNDTTFGTSLLKAGKGGGGGSGTDSADGGQGTSSSLGSGPIGVASQGASGMSASGNQQGQAGMGGATIFGGNGTGWPNGTSQANATAAVANSGGGGGGGTPNSGAGHVGGGGGAAGGYVDAIITSPASTYGYVVGAGGAGGSSATGPGGNGGSGIIIVYEFYQ